MSYKVIFNEQAQDDLNALFDYIVDNAGERTANIYVGRLQAWCSKPADFPHRGVARNDLGQGSRTMSFERRATIVYMVENDVVRILRVFHAGRDIDHEMSKD